MFRNHTMRSGERQAFTLIELMIVVTLIAVLIGIVFRMMSAASDKNKMARTIERLERLQNALSGYYAEYGSYPPVQQYGYPGLDHYYDGSDLTNLRNSDLSSESARSEAADRAARSQPLAFEYPPMNTASINQVIDLKYTPARSGAIVLGGTDWSTTDFTKIHEDAPIIFKFGLLSYLLPKTHIAWSLNGDPDAESNRKEKLFKNSQWFAQAVPSDDAALQNMINAQANNEKRTVARWLPNFENSIWGSIHYRPNDSEYKLTLGIRLGPVWDDGAKQSPSISLRAYMKHISPVNQAPYVLTYLTMIDGWGYELYYYSAPPYQSYRLWSSGPDGKTFPPWIPLKDYANKADAGKWIADDVVRFDH